MQVKVNGGELYKGPQLHVSSLQEPHQILMVKSEKDSFAAVVRRVSITVKYSQGILHSKGLFFSRRKPLLWKMPWIFHSILPTLRNEYSMNLVRPQRKLHVNCKLYSSIHFLTCMLILFPQFKIIIYVPTSLWVPFPPDALIGCPHILEHLL